MTVWFTSDLHLGHENIIEHQGRPFRDAEHMAQALIANINSVVLQRDTLYILGDFTMKVNGKEAARLRHRINCREVHLVRGNHDKKWQGETCPFSTVSDYLEIRLGPDRVGTVLMHYPIEHWNGSHHGSIHLHGHIHADAAYNRKAIDKSRRKFDVGVDANGYMPVSEYQVLQWAGLG